MEDTSWVEEIVMEKDTFDVLYDFLINRVNKPKKNSKRYDIRDRKDYRKSKKHHNDNLVVKGMLLDDTINLDKKNMKRKLHKKFRQYDGEIQSGNSYKHLVDFEMFTR